MKNKSIIKCTTCYGVAFIDLAQILRRTMIKLAPLINKTEGISQQEYKSSRVQSIGLEMLPECAYSPSHFIALMISRNILLHTYFWYKNIEMKDIFVRSLETIQYSKKYKDDVDFSSKRSSRSWKFYFQVPCQQSQLQLVSLYILVVTSFVRGRFDFPLYSLF